MSENPYLFQNLEYLKIGDKKIKKIFNAVHYTYITLDGKYIYAFISNKALDLWEIESRRLIKRVSIYGYFEIYEQDNYNKPIVILDGRNSRSNKSLKQNFGDMVIFKEINTRYKDNALHKNTDLTTFNILPKTKRLIYGDSDSGWLEVYNFSGIKVSEHQVYPYNISRSQDNQYFLFKDKKDKFMRYYDVRKQSVSTIQNSRNLLSPFIISPDNKKIISNNRTGSIEILEFPTGKLITSLKGYDLEKGYLAISSNGRYLAVVGSVLPNDGSSSIIYNEWYRITSKNINIIDLHIGSLVQTLTAHSKKIYSITFSENNRYLISSSQDQTIKIWDFSAIKKNWEDIHQHRKENLEAKFSLIEKLIEKREFKKSINELNIILKTAKEFKFTSTIKITEQYLERCYAIIIKSTIIDFSTKFARILLDEIKENTSLKNENLIEKIVKNMINNKEIYAEYFKSTKSIVFNQQANIEEIDNLMKKYEQWEKEEKRKI